MEIQICKVYDTVYFVCFDNFINNKAQYEEFVVNITDAETITKMLQTITDWFIFPKPTITYSQSWNDASDWWIKIEVYGHVKVLDNDFSKVKNEDEFFNVLKQTVKKIVDFVKSVDEKIEKNKKIYDLSLKDLED